MDNTPTISNLIPTVTSRDLRLRINAIQEAMRDVMQDGTHYGKIPGCGDKPALFKAGAEILGTMFRLAPVYAGAREPKELPGGHREYIITCTLQAMDGTILGQGVGSCSTLETKYRYRAGDGDNTGRPVPKEYWDAKKSNDQTKMKEIAAGCTPKKTDSGWFFFKKGERVENPDLADQFNTVLKMAKKRAHVDATLTCLAVSDIFTQDIEEQADVYDSRPEALRSSYNDLVKPTPTDDLADQKKLTDSALEAQAKKQAIVRDMNIKKLVNALAKKGVPLKAVLDVVFADQEADIYQATDEQLTELNNIRKRIEAGEDPAQFFNPELLEGA